MTSKCAEREANKKATQRNIALSDDERYVTNGIGDFYLTLLSFGLVIFERQQKRAHRV